MSEEREQDNQYEQCLRLCWDYTILCMTKGHVLVRLEKESTEYASYSHDNNGNCFSGFYTKDKNAAKQDFLERAWAYV